MARALPGTPVHITDSDGPPLGGTSRRVTRRQLRTQLARLDAQIDALIRVQSEDVWQTLERSAWIQPAAAKIVWAGRLELYYLSALREALLETLTQM